MHGPSIYPSLNSAVTSSSATPTAPPSTPYEGASFPRGSIGMATCALTNTVVRGSAVPCRSAEQRHRSELLLLAFGHGRAHAAEAMRACAWGTHVRRLARRVDVRKPWRGMTNLGRRSFKGARVGNLSASGPAAAVPDARDRIRIDGGGTRERCLRPANATRSSISSLGSTKCYLDLGANRFKNWNSPLNVFGCALFSFSIKDASFLLDSKLYIMLMRSTRTSLSSGPHSRKERGQVSRKKIVHGRKLHTYFLALKILPFLYSHSDHNKLTDPPVL
jgi:hypothetical protein